jgi:hypothetical protein
MEMNELENRAFPEPALVANAGFSENTCQGSARPATRQPIPQIRQQPPISPNKRSIFT